MTDAAALVQLKRKGAKRRHVSLVPFGIGYTKPHHFREMLRIVWANRRHLWYAWKILTQGVCDGCALGTTGLRDWTLSGTHLCLVRLNLLELNTADAMRVSALEDADALRKKSSGAIRALGRLPYPMRRRRGERGFTRVTWEEALEDLGARLRQARPERIATYMTSRAITNEVYFATQKAMRLLGSPNIDNAARLCHSPSTSAMKQTIGFAASTCSYKDWYGTDVIVFFGSNPANDQPVAMKYLDGAKKRGARVLVVNTYEEPGMKQYWVPSTLDSALFGTRIADRFFHVGTGGDLAFVLAAQKLLVTRGAVDHNFIDAHTDGFSDYLEDLGKLSFDELVRRSGATTEDVVAFASELAGVDKGILVWSMGITQHAHGADSVRAICQLGLSLGWIGRPKTGLMPIRGHSGVQGGAEMGAYATAFPGGIAVNEDNARALEAHWGFRPPAAPGLDTTRMVDAAERSELDVLYTIGGNFLETLPEPQRVEDALARVPVRIHQDIVVTQQMLVEPADVVYLLPAKTRYEHVGGVTETTTERRVVLSPEVEGHRVGDAKEEWWIPMALVEAALPDKRALIHYDDAAAIRRDIARTVPAYAEIDQLKFQGDQFQWGGARLCEGGVFPLPGGRAKFSPIDVPEPRVRPGELLLATRRGKQFNSMVQAERDMLTGADRDHVMISKSDMKSLGLARNDRIVVRSAHGQFIGRVFEAVVTPGNVQMHWPEANVLIGSGRVDPGGLVPDYNAVVRIERAEARA